jgi:hypothetical protein
MVSTFPSLWQISFYRFLGEETSLLLFSALDMPAFRAVKLRPRKSTCRSCGTTVPRVLRQASDSNSVQSCGNLKPDWEKQGLIDGPSRISVMVR